MSALSVSKIASKSKSQNMADYTTLPTSQAPMESQGIVEDGEKETTTNNFMQSINTGYSWSGGAIVDRKYRYFVGLVVLFRLEELGRRRA